MHAHRAALSALRATASSYMARQLRHCARVLHTCCAAGAVDLGCSPRTDNLKTAMQGASKLRNNMWCRARPCTDNRCGHWVYRRSQASAQGCTKGCRCSRTRTPRRNDTVHTALHQVAPVMRRDDVLQSCGKVNAGQDTVFRLIPSVFSEPLGYSHILLHGARRAHLTASWMTRRAGRPGQMGATTPERARHVCATCLQPSAVPARVVAAHSFIGRTCPAIKLIKPFAGESAYARSSRSLHTLSGG